MYLLEVWRKRTSTEQWIESLLDLTVKWQPLEWGFETGQITRSIGPFLERRARERRAYITPMMYPSRHDKSIRAQSIRGRMAMQGLYVPLHAHWFPDFLSEILSFPAGKYDDQVDCLSLIGQMLTRITPGIEPEKPKPIQVLCPPDGDDRYVGVTLEEIFELNENSGDRQPERI
jgi:predicted phage terminase large subunit-like protein